MTALGAQSSTPTVRLVDGLLQVAWPEPRPASFEIASDLFASMVDEMNAHRLAARDPRPDVDTRATIAPEQ